MGLPLFFPHYIYTLYIRFFCILTNEIDFHHFFLQTKTTELTANYKNLLEEVKGLKNKLGNGKLTIITM